MAMRPQTGGFPPVRSRPSMRPVFEDFRPMSQWKPEQESDVLLVHLPGFMREQVKVSVETSGIFRVYGRRPLGNNKWSRFNQEFRIPETCNVEGITTKFENQILSVTIPKKVVPPQIVPKEVAKTAPQEAATIPQKATGKPMSQKAQVDTTPSSDTSTIGGEKQIDKKDVVARSPTTTKPGSEPMSQKAHEDTSKQTDKKEGEVKSQKGEATLIADTEKQTDKKSAENVVQKTIEKKERSDANEMPAESKKYEEDKEKSTPEKEKENGKKSKESTTDKEVVERMGGKAKEDSNAVEAKKTTNAAAAAAGVSNIEIYKNAIKGYLPMKKQLSELERKSLVNMGAAIAVIVALGASVSYFGSSGKPKN